MPSALIPVISASRAKDKSPRRRPSCSAPSTCASAAKSALLAASRMSFSATHASATRSAALPPWSTPSALSASGLSPRATPSTKVCGASAARVAASIAEAISARTRTSRCTHVDNSARHLPL
eukprot:scaffold149_cov315-Pinguiococcus_pyrenoidosus.AAC.136